MTRSQPLAVRAGACAVVAVKISLCKESRINPGALFDPACRPGGKQAAAPEQARQRYDQWRRNHRRLKPFAPIRAEVEQAFTPSGWNG